MAVRLPIALAPAGSRRRAAWIQAVALANSGFESASPEILLPALLAHRLGLWPRLPAGAVVRTLGTAAGSIEVTHLPGGVRVRLGRGRRPVVACGAIVGESQDEAVLSDQALSALGVVLEDVGRGIWRLRGARARYGSPPAARWPLPAGPRRRRGSSKAR